MWMDLFVSLSSSVIAGITSAMTGIAGAMTGIAMMMLCAMAANRTVGRDGCLVLGRT
jgi:hypothetical protein